jgi:hypothetical protein
VARIRRAATRSWLPTLVTVGGGSNDQTLSEIDQTEAVELVDDQGGDGSAREALE